MYFLSPPAVGPPACLDPDLHATMIVGTTEGMTEDTIVMMIEKENTTGLTGIEDIEHKEYCLDLWLWWSPISKY